MESDRPLGSPSLVAHSFSFLSCARVSGIWASILVEADLSFSDLREADLSGANLSGADLFGSDLDGANLAAVIFDDETDWPDGFDPGQTAIRGP
jgi:uncharacterized protein YjbI with pentapeptide repeats